MADRIPDDADHRTPDEEMQSVDTLTPRQIKDAEIIADRVVQKRLKAERRAYRRVTLLYAALVAGVVSLLVVRLGDIAAYNAVRDFQASSCKQRHQNAVIANQNVSATKDLETLVHLPYLLSAAKARHQASELQIETDPRQAVINAEAYRYWKGELAGKAKDIVTRFEPFIVPTCGDVPEAQHVIPIRFGN